MRIIKKAKLKGKIIVCLCFASLMATGKCVYAAQNYKIYEADAWLGAGKDIWNISSNRCASLPEWKPQKGEPPLSLGKAASIASEWASSKNHGGDIESIEVYPVNRSKSGKFTSVFFYAITLEVAPYQNHISCVVLMDGTVLEPEPRPQKPALKK